uniref:Uncharacterized protein n=1 Tax=Glossina palpalis gambiensis TaxID=67801 RepID=A0A1B0BWI1_9MUSC
MTTQVSKSVLFIIVVVTVKDLPHCSVVICQISLRVSQTASDFESFPNWAASIVILLELYAGESTVHFYVGFRLFILINLCLSKPPLDLTANENRWSFFVLEIIICFSKSYDVPMEVFLSVRIKAMFSGIHYLAPTISRTLYLKTKYPTLNFLNQLGTILIVGFKNGANLLCSVLCATSSCKAMKHNVPQMLLLSIQLNGAKKDFQSEFVTNETYSERAVIDFSIEIYATNEE